MILLTGGTGSFGQALAAVMPRLRIFSRDEEKQRAMALRFPQHEYVVGDVRDQRALRAAASGVSEIIHAAALKQVPTGERHPSEVIETNVLGTRNVLDAADGRNVVLLSTDKAVEPVNAYGASKMLAEKLVLAYGGTVVRYGNVLGSRGSIIPVFRDQVARGLPLTITDPAMTRFVMTLDDAIDLVIRSRRGLNVADPPAATVAQFAEAIAPGHPQVIVGPRDGEKLHEKLGPSQTSETARRLTTDQLRALIERAGV